MKRSKYFWLTSVCLLLVGLGANVNEVDSKARVMQGPAISGMVTVNARQVSDGQLGFDFDAKSNTTFGLGFLGQTFGSVPGTLTLSLNVTAPSSTNGSEGSRSITGGFWTLPVFITEPRPEFVGSIYGSILQGAITPTQNSNKSQVTILMTIDGGTLNYEGETGRPVFEGTLTEDPRGGPSELEGTLTFSPEVGSRLQ